MLMFLLFERGKYSLPSVSCFCRLNKANIHYQVFYVFAVLNEAYFNMLAPPQITDMCVQMSEGRFTIFH